MNLMKKAVIGSTVFSVAAVGIVLCFALGKEAAASGVLQGEAGIEAVLSEEEGLAQEETPKVELLEEELSEENVHKVLMGVEGEPASVQEGSQTNSLRVPLPQGCKAEDILVENYYMAQKICVLINGIDPEFYSENAVSGNWDMVEEGIYEKAGDGVKLQFFLSGIYECQSFLENDNLYVSFLSPKETYDKIVVIDPAYGGADSGIVEGALVEKEISLEIAKKLKEKLDDTDIKVYYTRLDDVNPREEDRVKLANGTKADMYIRIQVDSNKDSEVYGTTVVYNGNYFIPDFGSVELADLLEREVVTSIKGKALGLSEAGKEEYTLWNATIPAVSVKVGCVTNEQEAILLGREDYLDKIADGIYNGILKVYEKREKKF